MSTAPPGGAYEWNANDYSNLVTISAAALASVLLVVFKSRCETISVCWGLWACQRALQESDGDDAESPPARANPSPEAAA